MKRDANPERHRARLRKWCEANPDAVKAIQQTRRARKRGAEGRYTQNDVGALLKKQNNQCLGCGVDFGLVKHTIDHIVPLSRGGSNWPINLQLLCGPCNCNKHTKLMGEWKQAA